MCSDRCRKPCISLSAAESTINMRKAEMKILLPGACVTIEVLAELPSEAMAVPSETKLQMFNVECVVQCSCVRAFSHLCMRGLVLFTV